MKGMGIVALSFVSVVTFSGMAIANASATELLFSSGTGSFSASGGPAVFAGASEVNCTTTQMVGTIETAHLGKMTVHFEHCTTQLLGSHVCTGGGEPSGKVTIPGPFHLNLGKKGTAESPHAAILFLVEPEVVFTCSGVGTVHITGSLVGLLFNHALTAPLVPAEELLHSHIVFNASGTKQEDKEFSLALTTPENEEMAAELKCEIFGIKGECGGSATLEFMEVLPAGLHLVNG